jgi:hypothetical protein
VVYGESVGIVIVLNPPLSNGTLTVAYVVDGQGATIGTYVPVNGEVNLTWRPPQAGNYTLVITYENPPNYSTTSISMGIVVEKIPCTISMVITGNLTVMHDVFISGHLEPPLANQQLILEINGTRIAVTTGPGGAVNYTYRPPLPGRYDLVIRWLGNVNYQSCSSTMVIDVDRAPVVMSVEESTSIVASGGSARFIVRLSTDVPNYLGGNLTVTITDVDSGNAENLTIPVGGGLVNVELPLARPGRYEVSFLYGGNAYVKGASSGSYSLEVIPGFLGIPWYFFIVYLAPVPAGYLVGHLLFRRRTRSP